MFPCNLQGLGSAISGNLGGIVRQNFLVRYARTDGRAPLRNCRNLFRKYQIGATPFRNTWIRAWIACKNLPCLKFGAYI